MIYFQNVHIYGVDSLTHTLMVYEWRQNIAKSRGAQYTNFMKLDDTYHPMRMVFTTANVTLATA